jgi:hypothetical protein
LSILAKIVSRRRELAISLVAKVKELTPKGIMAGRAEKRRQFGLAGSGIEKLSRTTGETF